MADEVGVALRRCRWELLGGIQVILSQWVVLDEPCVILLIQMAFAEKVEAVHDRDTKILDAAYHVLVSYQ